MIPIFGYILIIFLRSEVDLIALDKGRLENNLSKTLTKMLLGVSSY